MPVPRPHAEHNVEGQVPIVRPGTGQDGETRAGEPASKAMLENWESTWDPWWAFVILDWHGRTDTPPQGWAMPTGPNGTTPIPPTNAATLARLQLPETYSDHSAGPESASGPSFDDSSDDASDDDDTSTTPFSILDSDKFLSDDNPLRTSIRKFGDFVIQAYKTFTTYTIPVSETAHGPQQGNSSQQSDNAQAIAKYSHTSQNQDSIARPRKRAVDEDGDNHDNGDKRRKQDTETGESSSNGPKLPFACPFYKKNGTLYIECISARLTRARDVKQHLRRRHRSKPHCPICGETFHAREAQEAHIRLRNCLPAEFSEPEGVTDGQFIELDKGAPPKTDGEEQWFLIWRILFPKEARPSSPFIHGVVQEICNDFVPLYRRCARPILTQYLRTNPDPTLQALLRAVSEQELLTFMNEAGEYALGRLIDHRLHGTSSDQEATALQRSGDGASDTVTAAGAVESGSRADMTPQGEEGLPDLFSTDFDDIGAFNYPWA